MQKLLLLRNLVFGGVLAFSFLACSSKEEVGDALYAREVVGNVFETEPVRGAFRPLRNRRTGFEYKCSECHTSLKQPLPDSEFAGEHSGIQAAFAHGENITCVNCHHTSDRNAYVAHDGTSIPAEEPARLCGKCHGPTYREWRVGIHGRQNGYWDTEKGLRKKLMCLQCHDPHRPKFQSMTPDAPPIRSRLKLEAKAQAH